MKDFGKDFDTIDQARTRPIEIGRSVDSVKLSTPSRQKSSTPVFFDCPLERKSARHEDDDFGLSFQDPFGRNAFGFQSRLPEHLFVRYRAYFAQFLGDDEIGLKRFEQILLEAINGPVPADVR